MDKQTRRQFLKTMGFAAASAGTLLPLPSCARTAERLRTKRRTNIVFIFIDDLGWTDLGCFGSKYYETPNIDKLADEGVVFTYA